MSTIISGSSPSVTFSDGSTQASAASSAMTLISTQTASSSSSLSWTGLSGYDKYLLIIENATPSTASGFYCQIGTGSGPTYKTTGYASGLQKAQTGTNGSFQTVTEANYNSSSDSNFYVGGWSGNPTTTSFVNSSVLFSGILSNVGVFMTTNNYTYDSTAPFYEADIVSGFVPISANVTALKIYISGGNITSGKASLYGISS